MAGYGAPTLTVDGRGMRVAVIASSWHTLIMDGLLDGARRALAEAGVTDVVEVRVPGSFELPVVASQAINAGVHAVVALGVVIRGGTPHFDYVCEAATMGLTDLARETGVPVGFGVLTCDNERQALDRAGLAPGTEVPATALTADEIAGAGFPGSIEDKGYEAAQAAVGTVQAILAAFPSS
jgi:6,7-dimethyl-8-ribityllumazine synthase